jgi:hypothetical protein
MDYIKLRNLKELLNEYTNESVFYDDRDILGRLNDEIIEKMAIVVNRYLSGGKKMENLIRHRLERKVCKKIDEVVKFSLRDGSYIKPDKLKIAIKKSLEKEV